MATSQDESICFVQKETQRKLRTATNWGLMTTMAATTTTTTTAAATTTTKSPMEGKKAEGGKEKAERRGSSGAMSTGSAHLVAEAQLASANVWDIYSPPPGNSLKVRNGDRDRERQRERNMCCDESYRCLRVFVSLPCCDRGSGCRHLSPVSYQSETVFVCMSCRMYVLLWLH